MQGWNSKRLARVVAALAVAGFAAGAAHAQDAAPADAPSTQAPATDTPATAAPVAVTSIDALNQSALDRLMAAAEDGDAAAALAVARSYFSQTELEQQQQGVPFAEQAAELGSAEAQMVVGGIYRNGQYGVPPDPEKARAAFRSAMEQGSMEAQIALGSLLLDTEFTEEGRQEARKLLETAARQGEIAASNALAAAYVQGKGVEADVETALDYYGYGLVANDTNSILAVGDLLRTGVPGIRSNPAVAYELYQEASTLGNPSGQRRIADMTLRGEFVQKDIDLAIDTLVDLAGAGDSTSLVSLGNIYSQGEFAPIDSQMALKFYESAEQQGNLAATLRLGDIYMNGIAGVAPDASRAMELYSRAADLGSTAAKRTLAAAYLSGEGVVRNPTRAVELYEEAVEMGDGFAAESLAVIYAANDPFPADADRVREYLDLALQAGNRGAAISVGAAIADGPLARRDRNFAFQLLDDAVEDRVPGAAAELARLQLAGLFPAEGLTGVIGMLNTAALEGDVESARFLARFYGQGYGLLMPADPEAATAFLDSMEPVIGPEATAYERIILLAAQGEDLDTLQEISTEFAKLSKNSALQALEHLRQENARAYTYLIQERMIARGLYEGPLNGLLDNLTIRSFMAACGAAGAERACAPGPLTQSTASVLGSYLTQPLS